MTQDALAAASGIDQTHISGIETGRRSPSDDTKERLAKALELDPADLLFQRPRQASSIQPERDRAGQSDRPTSHRGLEER